MAKIFISCFLLFLMLYIIVDIFNHLDEILRQRLILEILVRYYLNFLPFIFMQVAPVACLLGCLYTLGSLCRHNEIIAMRTAGLSIFQITKTLLVFTSLVSVLVFLVNDRLVPKSQIITQNIKNQMEAKSKKTEAITNLSIYGLKNRLFFIDKFIPLENRIEGITILEQDRFANLRKKIMAKYGVWKDGLWHFYECITYNFQVDGRIQGQPQYSQEQVMDVVETPFDFLNQRLRPEFMSIAQLKSYIFKLSHSQAKAVVRNLKVDLYQRFFMPFISLVILIMGIPFGLKMRNRATGLSCFGIAIMLGFLYYVLNAVSLAFGKAGILPPIIAAASSHIIFLSLGLYLTWELT